MVIRDYRPQDLPALYRLFYETVHTVNRADYSAAQTDAWAPAEMDRSRWEESLLRNRTLVAEEKGEILGFGDLEEGGCLDRLYVHRAHQRKGVAKAIVDRLEQAAMQAGCDRIVTEASLIAWSFFTSRGYRTVKRQEKSLRGQLFVNYVMEKRLIDQGGTPMKNPIVTIEMESGNKMLVELYPEIAPNTVKNFVSLVQKGFYDGLIFHRVIPGFMIQGGDPEGVGIGGPGYSIPGEFALNGFANPLKHTKGVISMARSSRPDSAGSQFFIMVDDAPHLDGSYAAFGKVIEGIEEADRIVKVRRNLSDKPLMDERMVKVTVDTFGEEIGEPVKL